MASIEKSWANVFARTPLHPQWLLGRRRVPSGIAHASGRILDIGAADRWIEPHLPRGIEYVALDYPSTGRDMYGAMPHVFADGARLPFPDGCFDGVVCLEVLEHVPDPAIVVTQIGRVLKRGGRAWLSMPFLYPLHDAPFDFQRYTEYGLARDIARAGLHVVSLQKSNHAVHAAGLLACLAIAGGAYAKPGARRICLLPVAAVAILLINLIAWLLGKAWPDWGHMATGHVLEVRKP
ncbi:class I SAM-dependent methyltransferase [Dyella choica]|uniref:Class I SAM-dependent methyltransferase n=1 Tax=Dyella choica TaxID=1927959 RepID=A0A3S0R4G3_9GAMM|nr:class I SAM-dependent methyltransferase [Dyella choica]RUL76741.1 class I SAM-dependent methyltransferase [Dyella choica]